MTDSKTMDVPFRSPASDIPMAFRFPHAQYDCDFLKVINTETEQEIVEMTVPGLESDVIGSLKRFAKAIGDRENVEAYIGLFPGYRMCITSQAISFEVLDEETWLETNYWHMDELKIGDPIVLGAVCGAMVCIDEPPKM